MRQRKLLILVRPNEYQQLERLAVESERLVPQQAAFMLRLVLKAEPTKPNSQVEQEKKAC